MALARLALKRLHQRVLSSPSSAAASFMGHGAGERAAIIGGAQSFSTESTDKVAGETSDGKQVQVSDSKKSRSLFPRKQKKRSLWRRNQGDFHPALFGTHSTLSSLLSFLVFFALILFSSNPL